MYSYSSEELRRVSCIGKPAIIRLVNGEEIAGTLTHINIEDICVMLPTEAEQKIRYKSIGYILFEKADSISTASRKDIKRFMHDCNQYAENAQLTLARVYREKFAIMQDTCVNKYIKDYICAELNGTVASYTTDAVEQVLGLMDSDVSAKNDLELYSLLAASLHFRMRRYDRAITLLLSGLKAEGIASTSLKIACIMAQMKNQIGTLYWLENYYANIQLSEMLTDNTWWLYLRLCSKYAHFGGILHLLTKLSGDNPLLAIKSLAYLLLNNNNNVHALIVLGSSADSVSESEALSLIERFGVFLVSDPDNNFHRYKRCVSCIIQNNDIMIYDDGEDITGYVYDYIPDREFGFIVGFDLVGYFFRKESIVSENVTKQIKNNICAFLEVHNEDLVMVTFKRSTETKRSYAAVDIV